MCFVFSSRRRHTRCALVTGVQTCALPICALGNELPAEHEDSNAGEPSQPDRELHARRAALPGLAAVGESRDWHHCLQRRTWPEVYSTAMTMAMMISTMAAAESNASGSQAGFSVAPHTPTPTMPTTSDTRKLIYNTSAPRPTIRRITDM